MKIVEGNNAKHIAFAIIIPHVLLFSRLLQFKGTGHLISEGDQVKIFEKFFFS